MRRTWRRYLGAILFSVAALVPVNAAFACDSVFVGISTSGKTAIVCFLQYGITELDGSGRETCYYGNCVITEVVTVNG